MAHALSRFARLTGLGALGALVVGLARSASRRPKPATSGAANWPPLTEPAPAPSRSGPVQFSEPISSTEAPSTEAPSTQVAEAGWVEPDEDGACPVGHPIKGNAQSKIFHVPGGGSYARTKAERCYGTAAEAEADGFRQAKR